MFLNLSFVIVSHRFIPTLADDLKKFLQKRGVNWTFIWHEFAALATRRSCIENKGSVTWSPNYRWLSDSLVYIKNMIYTVWWLLTKVKKASIYVGYGAFNVVPGIWLRSWLGIKKIVFYTVDFAPNRFKNKWLNNVYKRIDAYAMKYADETWNLSPRMEVGRERLWRLKKEDYPRQRVVPLGVWIRKEKLTPKYSQDIFFSGHLMEKQGVQLVIKALPQILKFVPRSTLWIVGEGEYSEELKKLTALLKLQKHVHFTGRLDADQQRRLMIKSGVAVAPYNPAISEYSQYADSAKIKTYLSAGLPVVLTDVTYNAKEIEKYGCGLVVPYSQSALAGTVTKVLANPGMQRLMKRRAIKYISKFDWEEIFTSNFKRVIAA